ncbi:hypothetical protein BDB00DRAFT_794370 [Zychaea mexicana]|uniref:uncharacterized protein n=1 Tax=Zychaea mexicana TaxID=64656 RepID=UPI0022FEF2B2|nr:uncharacterized protein BDB00DRAFT_794370 [Zychaea mexicana]KAI9499532.1 hypothetical protein BDB00DRAFT_794370 [Zychaea mexicana]
MASTAEWTVLEKLLLAQAVYKFGEDNWFQIARNLKQHSMLDRQPEFFNQKNCSLQYYLLIEDLENEKRQTKSSASATAQDMPPVVKLAKQLYIQRIDELKRAIKQDDVKFMQLIGEIEEIRAGKWDAKLGSQVEEIEETTITPQETTATVQQAEFQQQQQQQQQESLSSSEKSEKGKEDEPKAEVKETSSQAVSPTSEAATPTMTTSSVTSTTPTTTMAPATSTIDVQYTPARTSAETTAQSLTQSADIMEVVSEIPPSSQPKAEASTVEAMSTTPPQQVVQTPTPEQEKVPTPVEKVEPMEVDTREPEATMVPSVVEETAAPAQALQHEPHVTAQPTVSPPLPQHQSDTTGQQKPTTPAMSASPQSDTSYQSALEATPAATLVQPATLDESTVTTDQQAALPPGEPAAALPSEGEKRKLEDFEMTENYNDEQQATKRQRLEQPSKESTAEYQDNEGSQEQLGSAAATSLSADEERIKTEPSSEPKSPEAMNLKSPEGPLSVMSGADAEGTESVTGSESNAPTPTSSSDKRKSKDEQRQQKSWQKNINLLWREIANHKNGAMFMNPIKEATAPLYYEVVKHPVDLKTIKNRIRDGAIKTTVEFERDIVLMLTNSLMYNKEGTEIYQMALEMLEDVNEQLKLFKTADSNSSTTTTHTRKASTVAKDRRKSVAE